tara:strand:- start:514 stop:645 length:132 start_codon:yes stop_codon:yes gene_type:complete
MEWKIKVECDDCKREQEIDDYFKANWSCDCGCTKYNKINESKI